MVMRDLIALDYWHSEIISAVTNNFFKTSSQSESPQKFFVKLLKTQRHPQLNFREKKTQKVAIIWKAKRKPQVTIKLFQSLSTGLLEEKISEKLNDIHQRAHRWWNKNTEGHHLMNFDSGDRILTLRSSGKKKIQEEISMKTFSRVKKMKKFGEKFLSLNQQKWRKIEIIFLLFNDKGLNLHKFRVPDILFCKKRKNHNFFLRFSLEKNEIYFESKKLSFQEISVSWDT